MTLIESFKSYDVRGVGLSFEDAVRLGKAFARLYGNVVLGRDNKKSSYSLSRGFIKGVLSQGMNVYDLGKVPTDLVSFASKHYGLCSCMITASHLGYEYDGFKFNYVTGASFMSEDLNNLRDAILIDYNDSGSGVCFEKDLRPDYFNSMKNCYHNFFDYDLKGLRIVLDLKGGVSMAPELLSMLNADIISVINSNGPDPKESNLKELSSEVVRRGVHLGIAFDCDADRAVFVDDKGRKVNGNHITCLLAKRYGSPVIASIDASSIIEGFAEIIYSRVGDPNVLDALINTNGVLGVEPPSGHYTDPNHALCSSGALFSSIIAGLIKDESLSSLVSELPEVRLYETAFEADDDKKEFYMKIAMNLTSIYGLISDIDGFKFYYKGMPAGARGSGTSDKFRLWIETDNKDLINEFIGEFK